MFYLVIFSATYSLFAIKKLCKIIKYRVWCRDRQSLRLLFRLPDRLPFRLPLAIEIVILIAILKIKSNRNRNRNRGIEKKAIVITKTINFDYFSNFYKELSKLFYRFFKCY